MPRYDNHISSLKLLEEMSISEIYPTQRIFEIEIEAFTDEELALACTGNRLNPRFVRTVDEKKSIRETIILGRFPLYVQLLKDAHPDFPIRWVDHISPVFDAKSKLKESTLYTYQPFLFRVQERVTQTFAAPDPKRDWAMIETLVRIEVTRKEDNVIVLGGLFTLAEQQDAEVLEMRRQNFVSSLQTA